jgi:hypothetical protein
LAHNHSPVLESFATKISSDQLETRVVSQKLADQAKYQATKGFPLFTLIANQTLLLVPPAFLAHNHSPVLDNLVTKISVHQLETRVVSEKFADQAKSQATKRFPLLSTLIASQRSELVPPAFLVHNHSPVLESFAIKISSDQLETRVVSQKSAVQAKYQTI